MVGWSVIGRRRTVYVKRFEAGTVNVPGHSGKSGNSYGIPHAAFVSAGIPLSK